MDAALAIPVERTAEAGADRPVGATQDLAEARRRRQVVMSRWEDEGGAVDGRARRS